MQRYKIYLGRCWLDEFDAESPEAALTMLGRKHGYSCYQEYYWYNNANLLVHDANDKLVTSSIKFGQGSNYVRPEYWNQPWPKSK